MMAHMLKTIIAFQRHGDFKERRSDIFIFLEKSFCGRMLAVTRQETG